MKHLVQYFRDCFEINCGLIGIQSVQLVVEFSQIGMRFSCPIKIVIYQEKPVSGISLKKSRI